MTNVPKDLSRRLILRQPVLQLGEGNGARFLQASGSEFAHPVVVNFQGGSNRPMLAYSRFNICPGLFDALLYARHVATLVLTRHSLVATIVAR